MILNDLLFIGAFEDLRARLLADAQICILKNLKRRIVFRVPALPRHRRAFYHYEVVMHVANNLRPFQIIVYLEHTHEIVSKLIEFHSKSIAEYYTKELTKILKEPF